MEDFVLNDQCKYLIEAPLLSREGDKIHLMVNKLEHTKAWVFYGESFDSAHTQIEIH